MYKYILVDCGKALGLPAEYEAVGTTFILTQLAVLVTVHIELVATFPYLQSAVALKLEAN